MTRLVASHSPSFFGMASAGPGSKEGTLSRTTFPPYSTNIPGGAWPSSGQLNTPNALESNLTSRRIVKCDMDTKITLPSLCSQRRLALGMIPKRSNLAGDSHDKGLETMAREIQVQSALFLDSQILLDTGKPFLGICLGLQCAVIEFARNVLHLADANSIEINPNTGHPVVVEMPEHNPGDLGGTMRLGKRKTVFKEPSSILRHLYGDLDEIEERHRHRFEVNPKYIKDLESAGMKFVGQDVDNVRMEIMELDGHPFYAAVQYHPEYLSRPMRPSPPYLGLILAATNRLQLFLNKGVVSRASTRVSHTHSLDSDSDEEFTKMVRSLSVCGAPKPARQPPLEHSPSSGSIASSQGDHQPSDDGDGISK